MRMNAKRPFRVPVTKESDTNLGTECAPGPWYAEPQEPIENVRDVLLVASGKGGVGKSTVTVNLACALKREGDRVGVVDADLYGPSVARMLGTDPGLELNERGRIIPAESYGIYSVSVANVLPPEAALAWKGPLVAQTLKQMFYEVAWPELDVLLVDLPPGTGDVQLTILEQVPVTGAVLVTTPQRLALADVERGVALFHDLDIPVFGVVENMSRYVCPCCGEAQPLFAAAGTSELAKHKYVPYLGEIPLDPAAHRYADDGLPLVLSPPEGPVSQAMHKLAQQVKAAIQREYRSRLRETDEKTRAAHEAFWEHLLDE